MKYVWSIRLALKSYLGVQNVIAGPLKMREGPVRRVGLLAVLTVIVGNVTALILIVSCVSCSSFRALTQYSAGANDRAEVITARRHPCGSAAIN